MNTYVENGQVRYIFVNFPLYSMHPRAQKAAEAAECAGEQGQYWEMHDVIFARQDQWSGQGDAESALTKLAGNLDLDEAEFGACLEEGRYADRVAADYQQGLATGISSTPSFLINGTPLIGAQSLAAFKQKVDYYLGGGEMPTLEMAVDSYRSMGQADAPVVVTEFSDYQCSACTSIARQVIPDLIEQYVDTGKIRFVYREFPLSSHPVSQQASEAAICAGQQGKYWEMNEHLFANQDQWAQAQDPVMVFKDYAQEFDLDTTAFEECLDSQEVALAITGDLIAGETFGVDATPYFFINDLPIRGGLPIESLGQIIDYVAAGGQTPQIVPQRDDWHVRGDLQTAKAFTVAFVDFASPQSGEHAREVLPRLIDEYIDGGQWVYILHPWSAGPGTSSEQAAIAAECAGMLGKYWEMYDQLFGQQETWTAAAKPRPLFVSYADSLGLESDEFETCLDSEAAALRVQAGNVVATLYHVPGAPVFLFNNGSGQEGSPSFDEFKMVIDSIINQ